MAIDSPIPPRATELRGRRGECAELDRLIEQEERFRRRLDALPPGTRRLLQLAAAGGEGASAVSSVHRAVGARS